MFQFKPANAKTRLLYGAATNDAEYQVSYHDDEGKLVTCPFYKRWHAMLTRVFDKGFHARHPSYAGCSVHEDWLLFSNFRAWMAKQNWEGKHLDKDLLVQGNKEYGPDTCLFVSRELNNLLCLRDAQRGDLPLGVTTAKVNGYTYFTAACSFYGKQKRLGYFKTPDEAARRYAAAKNAYIQELAAAEADPRLAKALEALLIS